MLLSLAHLTQHFLVFVEVKCYQPGYKTLICRDVSLRGLPASDQIRPQNLSPFHGIDTPPPGHHSPQRCVSGGLKRGTRLYRKKDLSCYRDFVSMGFLLFLTFRDSDFPLLKRLASLILNGGRKEG